MKLKKLMTFCQKRFEKTSPSEDHCSECRYRSKCYDVSPLFIGGEPMLGLKDKAKQFEERTINSIILKEAAR